MSKLLHDMAPSLVIAEPGHEIVVKVVNKVRRFTLNGVVVKCLQERVVDICIIEEDQGFEQGKFAF